MLLAVTAEEQGLIGSAYYGANPLVPLDKTVAALNMDGLNNLGKTKDIVVVGLTYHNISSKYRSSGVCDLLHLGRK